MCALDFWAQRSMVNSLSLRIFCWFGTIILFILQDSLIRVSRRDEERRILEELEDLIDAADSSKRRIKEQATLFPNFRLIVHSRASMSSFLFLGMQWQSPAAPSSKSQVCDPPLGPVFLHMHTPLLRADCSKPHLRSFSSHSVPSMQFQVLLTCLSAFFSTFLRSTYPLSVFMSYLDLGEIYLLFYAEISINVTLKRDEIWKNRPSDKGVSPSVPQLSNWLSDRDSSPNISLKRSIGLQSVLSTAPFPLICALFVRHY